MTNLWIFRLHHEAEFLALKGSHSSRGRILGRDSPAKWVYKMTIWARRGKVMANEHEEEMKTNRNQGLVFASKGCHIAKEAKNEVMEVGSSGARSKVLSRHDEKVKRLEENYCQDKESTGSQTTVTSRSQYNDLLFNRLLKSDTYICV